MSIIFASFPEVLENCMWKDLCQVRKFVHTHLCKHLAEIIVSFWLQLKCSTAQLKWIIWDPRQKRHSACETEGWNHLHNFGQSIAFKMHVTSRLETQGPHCDETVSVLMFPESSTESYVYWSVLNTSLDYCGRVSFLCMHASDDRVVSCLHGTHFLVYRHSVVYNAGWPWHCGPCPGDVTVNLIFHDYCQKAIRSPYYSHVTVYSVHVFDFKSLQPFHSLFVCHGSCFLLSCRHACFVSSRYRHLKKNFKSSQRQWSCIVNHKHGIVL